MHGPRPDELVVSYKGNGTVPLWSYQDHQASVIAVAVADGVVHWINTYDEYGAPNPVNNLRMMSTGQMWLLHLGVYNYKARAHHPRLGRFMQTDPVGYEEGLNLYAAVGQHNKERRSHCRVAAKNDMAGDLGDHSASQD